MRVLHGLVGALVIAALGCGKSRQADDTPKPAPAPKPRVIKMRPKPDTKTRLDTKHGLSLASTKHTSAPGYSPYIVIKAKQIIGGPVRLSWHGGSSPPRALELDQITKWSERANTRFTAPSGMPKPETPQLAKNKQLDEARRAGVLQAQTRYERHKEAAPTRTVLVDDRNLRAKAPFKVVVRGPVSGPYDSYAISVLADPNSSARLLAEVVARLCRFGALLAVLSPDGYLESHRVKVGTFTPRPCVTAHPWRPAGQADVGATHAIAIELGKDKLIASCGKDDHVIATKDTAAAATQLAKLLQPQGRYRVLVAVGAAADVRALIRLLDVLDRLGLRHVHLGVAFARAKAAVAERNASAADLNSGRKPLQR